MININLNKLILKIIFLKNFKNNNKNNFNSYNKNNEFLLNTFLKKKNYQSSNIFKFYNQKSFFFFKKNLFNFTFLNYFYLINFFLKTLLIKKLVRFNICYKTILYKQKNLTNMIIYNFFTKKKLFFFKNFNKNYITKRKKRHRGLLSVKIIKIKKTQKKKFNFNNFNSFFLNFVQKKTIKSKTKNYYFKKKLLFLKKIDNFFFNSFKSPSVSFFNLNLINFYKLTTVKNNFKIYNMFFKRFKKKKKFNFYENSLYIRKKFNIIQKKKLKKPFKFFFIKLNTVFKKYYYNFNFFKNFQLFIYFYSLNIFFNIKFSLEKKKIIIKRIKNKGKNKKKIFKKEKFKKISTRINYNFFKHACKNIIFMDNFYNNSLIKYNKFNQEGLKSIYNIFNIGSLKILNNYKFLKLKNLNNFFCFNNYYPVFYYNNISSKKFFSKFKLSFNINYLVYIQFYILGFMENFFKKKILLKLSNNFFRKTGNFKFLNSIFLENKNYQPKYMKGFYICDFIEILWYSFFLKDLTLINDWFCKFFEATHFRFHRKFILFLQNFMNKHSHIFINVLKIKGFFFDIRGKVGVAGNSKKRHYFFRFGELNKSTKSRKINFNQSVIRTPSGALGLTLIINY